MSCQPPIRTREMRSTRCSTLTHKPPHCGHVWEQLQETRTWAKLTPSSASLLSLFHCVFLSAHSFSFATPPHVSPLPYLLGSLQFNSFSLPTCLPSVLPVPSPSHLTLSYFPRSISPLLFPSIPLSSLFNILFCSFLPSYFHRFCPFTSSSSFSVAFYNPLIPFPSLYLSSHTYFPSFPHPPFLHLNCLIKSPPFLTHFLCLVFILTISSPFLFPSLSASFIMPANN